MFAKQAIASASLVLVAGAADADPDATGGGTFQLGAGYSTDDKLMAIAAVDQPNLFHTGNELGMIFGISARRMYSDLHFMDPHLLGSDLSLSADLFSDRRLLPGFVRSSAGIGTTASAPLGPHLRAFVGYRLEQVTVDDKLDVLARGAPAPPPEAAGLISSLRAGLEYNTLDSRILPRRGTVIGASLEYAAPHLGSSIELATVRAWAGTHQPIGPFTLHLEGSVTSLASPSAIPLSERLFLDGSRDVRGFAPGAIGPVGGATFEAIGRASLEVPVYGGLSLEGFADHAELDTARGTSTGFGLIWRTPIGPLHVDLAFPLGDSHPALIFGIGGMF